MGQKIWFCGRRNKYSTVLSADVLLKAVYNGDSSLFAVYSQTDTQMQTDEETDKQHHTMQGDR